MKEIILIDSSPTQIFEDAKKIYKELTGEEVPTATEVSYILSTVSALIGNVKAEMNNVAIENYLPFAKGQRLDLKGIMYGSKGERLKPNKARTTMRCYVSSLIDREIIIPKGTRFLHKAFIFVTEEDFFISENLFVDIPVVCETTGDIGIIKKGEINEIVDRYDYFESCENITDVTGGRDIENDEEYRKRLAEIPESFTTAGSKGAYIFWTRKSSSVVTDVVVKTPNPNVVDIYVCNAQSVISSEEKDKIKKFLENPEIKVLNDLITIKDPSIKNYQINITYFLYKNPASIESLEKELYEKITEYSKSLKIGESINLQDIVFICKTNQNIKRIIINEPTEILEITDTTILNCESIKFTYGGI